jgi:glutamate-ammonia-ligase adenylyltransferase
LKALRGLAQLELIPPNEIVDLDRAYRFLRRTEHRLQIEAEQQTHTIPAVPEHLRRLALSLGFGSREEFITALEREMLAVRSVFRRLIAEALPGKRPELIDSGVFANQLDAEKEIAGLGQGPSGAHVSPRTRQAFRKLRPLLLAQLAKTTDPDATLNQFVRFVEAYGLRSLLFELLVTNPKLLELLVKTFDASRFASDLLVRRPQLLEDITRDEKLDRSIGMTGHLEQLRSLGKKENSLDRLRAYRQAQLLRILLRDVLSLADFATVCREQSALAEACLVCVNEIFGGDELTIIAMGKFGGHEITYGADLDVLFVGNESRDAQKLLSVLAQPSAEGNLSRVDARLRPEGEKGPLVCSLETYQRYYAERAHSWELQALTRARPVIGPLQTEFMAIAKNAWDKAGQHVDLYTKIDNMLERIRRERSSGDEFLEFKTGSGGIIEAEFLVQALQMRNAIWEPNWTSAVERLREVGQFTEAETRALKGAYEFLRGCESVLRRYENKSVSALPTDLNEQRKLAKRLGYSDANAFTKEYVDVRETMHALYQRHIKKTLASS